MYIRIFVCLTDLWALWLGRILRYVTYVTYELTRLPELPRVSPVAIRKLLGTVVAELFAGSLVFLWL